MMQELDATITVTVIRGLAALLFLAFLARSREPRHAVLAVGWLLYAVSGGLRGVAAMQPERYWPVVGLTSVGGTGMIMSAAVAYLQPKALGVAAPLAVATVLSSLLVMVLPSAIDFGVSLYLLQAAFLLAPVVIFAGLKDRAQRLFPGASTFLCGVLLSSVAFTVVVAGGSMPFWVAVTGTAILNAALTAFFVLTEHEIAVEAARRTETVFQRAEAAVGIGLWQRDTSGSEGLWSPGHFRILGLPPDTARTPSWDEFLSFIHPDDRPQVTAVRRTEQATGDTETLHYRIVRPDGQMRWITSKAVLIDPGTTFGIIVDITDLKHTQQKLKESLAQKDALIAEIQHRVKNNLQVIASMFRLQFDGVEDPDMRAEIDQFQSRIEAMATGQGILLDSASLNDVDMDWYSQQITTYLGARRGAAGSRPAIHTDMRGIHLDTNRAVVVGSIVSELAGGKTERILLEQCEDCYGLSATGDFETDSVALALMGAYAAQLSGSLSVEDHGHRVVITFPLAS
jgi:two-component sensor histidine kinase/PAS domain-containing protein